MGSLTLSGVSDGGGGVALVANGIVDDHTVEQFEHALDRAVEARRELLVIDLTSCQLASAGLAALIRLHRSPERRPETTLVVATDVDLLWTLHVVGLSYWCQVFATLGEALEARSPAELSIAGVAHE
ncbi:MAG: STAS domain-containing protein [Gaiellaceae bacterium]